MLRQILVILSISTVYNVYADTVVESKPQAMVSNGTANMPPTQLMNKVVAYVNKRIITQNELDKQTAQALGNLQKQGVKGSNTQDLQKQVLDQMILQQAQLDLAARGGIKTTDTEINQTIANIEKSQGLTDAQMSAKLISQGSSMAEFRQQIGDQITIEKVKQREVDARVFVNDDEITRVLNSETYKNRVDYKLSNILIGIPEQATQDVINQKQQLANQIYQQLQKGQSFEQLAIKYSTAPNALNGGDMGWKSNTSLPPQVIDQLQRNPPNGILQPMKFPIGFLIFKVTATKQHGTPQIVRQYNVRHILVKVNELTSDDEAHQKIDKIYNQLAKDKGNKIKESEDFVMIAKQSSDDPGSAIKGGDIGWTSKGDTVPQFEQTILSTPIGEISKPFRSPFGWHILQVINVRDSNMANEKEKSDIRQELRETKAQILYTEWLRNIREMAYVKINE